MNIFFSLLVQVLETDSNPGSVEIVSVAEDEPPSAELCLFYKRFFCLQQAKVDPSENENGKTTLFIILDVKEGPHLSQTSLKLQQNIHCALHIFCIHCILLLPPFFLFLLVYYVVIWDGFIQRRSHES